MHVFHPAPTLLGQVVVFDLETTSDVPDEAEIIEVAAVRPDGATFQRFVATQAPVPRKAFDITHIDPVEYERGKTAAGAALQAFLTFVGGAPLAGHNIYGYDLPVLERALADAGLPRPPGLARAFDTLRWALLRHPLVEHARAGGRTLAGYTLSHLHAYYFGEGFEDAHRALEDCRANLRVLHELAHDPPPLAVLRAWTSLNLPEAAFYDAPPYAEDELLGLLRVEAAVERVQRQGAAFPGVETLFPGWLAEVVAREGLDDAATRALLEAVRNKDAGHPLAAEFINTEGAPEAARHMLALGLGVRTAQHTMARAVRGTLAGAPRVAMVEAPTGTGKTKGYLYPALHHLAGRPGERVVVATHTKVLQRQGLSELQKVGEHYAASAAVVRSVRDYLCLDALHDALAAHKPAADHREAEGAALAALVGLATLAEYDLESLPFNWSAGNAAFRELKVNVRTYPHRCRESCPYYHHCAFQKDRRGREEASIWVTNQAWLLANAKENADGEAAPVHFVIDEAHNLEDVATQAFSKVQAGEEIRFHLRRLYDPERRRGLLERRNLGATPLDTGDAALLAALPEGPTLGHLAAYVRDALLPQAYAALAAYGERLVAYLSDRGQGERKYGLEVVLTPTLRRQPAWTQVLRLEREWLGALKNLLAALKAVPPRAARGPGGPELYDLLRPTTEALQAHLDFLFERRGPSPPDDVHLVRLDANGNWSHVAQPIELAPLLRPVWAGARSLTLTSATLAPGGNFGYLQSLLGLEEAVPLRLPESLPYERAHVVIPTHLPEARTGSLARFQSALHEELAHILPAAGRSLTLFTSRERMKEAGEALSTLPDLLTPLTRREREDVAGRMLDAARPASALGTRAFMEGVDFPDLRVVGLERVPFPVVSTLLQERQNRITLHGGDWWGDYYLPKAMLTFIQAFGRLVRDDRGRVGDGAFILWDKRVLSATYAFQLLEVLPGTLLASERLHRPVGRAAFYDTMAGILDLERGALPYDDLRDATRDELERLRRAYAAGETDLDTVLKGLLALFWGERTFDEERWQTQLEAVQAALEGRDALVLLPTGYGKSLTYQLPALLTGGLTLVVSPLIALMNDQVAAFSDASAPIRAVNASLSKAEQRGVLADVERGDVNLLYVSPERLLKSRDLEEVLKRLEARGEFRRIVLDEAHCLSEQGHDFRPDYRRVLERLTSILTRRPSVACLTATATPRVARDLRACLGLDGAADVSAPLDRANITYYAQNVPGKDADVAKLQVLLELLGWLDDTHRADPAGWSVIVYAGTRALCERLAATLVRFGFAAQAYHAGLNPRVRGEVQERFMGGAVRVVVATTAFGMGIDKGNVRAVVHTTPSLNLPAYVQEAGRAGRDGKPAYALLLHSRRDWGLLSWINDAGQPEEGPALDLLAVLKAEGSFVGYPAELARAMQERSGAAALEPQDVLWLLDTLAQAELLTYDHRVGRVRLVLRTWEALGGAVTPEQRDLLGRLGVTPGAKPNELDLSALPLDQADALCGALWARARESFDLIVSASDPALAIERTAAPGGDALPRFREVLRRRSYRRQQDLEGFRRYAEVYSCRREGLLRAFEDAPKAGRDRAHCCDVCNRDNLETHAPWRGHLRPYTQQEIAAVHRCDRVVLEYLDWHRRNWHEWRNRSRTAQTYSGLGKLKITMVLRGRAVEPRKAGAVHLKYHEQNSRYFGTLEFVSDREIRKALSSVCQRGFIERQDFTTAEGRAANTYRITPAGTEHVRRSGSAEDARGAA